MKKCYIIAGVNGAGKTTLYAKLSDKIRSVKRQELAGKEARDNIFGFISKGEEYCQETALCGQDIIDELMFAKEHGYYIEMHYIYVENVKIAIDRVHNRVRNGGHFVPDEMVIARYVETKEKLNKMLPIIDKIVVYNNSKDKEMEQVWEGAGADFNIFW